MALAAVFCVDVSAETLDNQYSIKAFREETSNSGNGTRIAGALWVDNTTDRFVTPWLAALQRISPREVMIYTIDRETPDQSLRKATHEELDAIRNRVIAAGIPCTASY